MKKNILHITPHLGGGVGTVLLNWLCNDFNNNNTVITLDYANENAKKRCAECPVNLISEPSGEYIIKEIDKADITVIHVWNHPLLYDFLIRNKLPASRVAFWLHTAGLNLPYIFPEKLLNYPDICVLSTPLTYQAKEVKNLIDKSKLRLIWATGGCQNVKNINKKPHEQFNIGYIGTVDYFRLHKEFIKILAKVNIKKARFIVCGGPNEKLFGNEAKDLGVLDKFVFTGQTDNIEEYLSVFDVFAYLLSPIHCGSCDQALQEAMTAGVVPVVMNNPMETSMVEHNVTGLVANNEEEYVSYIEFLYRDSALRKTLSANARNYALKNFLVDNVNCLWNKVFDELMQKEKTPKHWDCNTSCLTSFDIFLESLGSFKKVFMLKSDNELRELFKNPNWQSDNKGTPKQYFKFLGGEELKRIVNLYEQ